MAWLSVGTCNDDLCNKMVQHGVLKEGSALLEAFQKTDRGHFVPLDERSQAYLDRPFRSGSIHISAPHMYVTVLEAFDLQRGNSFLNVGSGSGYLSCLASYLLRGVGICHGVEISAAAVEHSKICTRTWMEQFFVDNGAFQSSSSQARYLGSEESIRYVHGNCFDIDVLSTMNSCKYDRIYVGAGCPEKRKEFFFSMLADNGVLIIPIHEKNQMLRIKRYMGTIFSSTVISNVHFAPLTESVVVPRQLSLISTEPPKSAAVIPKLSNFEAASVAVYHTTCRGDEQDQTSRARRAEVAKSTSYVKLPVVIWGPTALQHRQFPPEFKSAVFFILLSTRRYVTHSMNNRSLFGSIPFYIWINILTFASRDWFTPQKTEPELLKAELSVERQLRLFAESKLREVEAAKRKAERDRDLYKMVILKVRSSHIPLGLQTEDFNLDEEEEDDEDEDEDDEEEEDEEGVLQGGEEIEEEEEETGEGVDEEMDGAISEENAGEEHDEVYSVGVAEEEEVDMFDDDDHDDDEEEEEEEYLGDNHDYEEHIHIFHSEESNADNRSNDRCSGVNGGHFIFSDPFEAQAETSYTREMPAPSLPRQSQNVTALPSITLSSAGNFNKESISTSFNSHTTNEFSMTSLSASWVPNETENMETTNRYISNGYHPSNLNTSRVGKHNRRGEINDAGKKSSGHSDSDSDDDSASCVSFLSMGSEYFSLERDSSKKHRSLSEEFLTTERMSLSISNIEEVEEIDDGDDDNDDDKAVKRIGV